MEFCDQVDTYSVPFLEISRARSSSVTANTCGSRKSVSFDSIANFAITWHPHIHGSHPLFSIFGLHLHLPVETITAAGNRCPASSALGVSVAGATTTHWARTATTHKTDVAIQSHVGLSTYLEYYHPWRTHRSLDQDAPDGRRVRLAELDHIVEFPVVQGLHHYYLPKAA